MLGPLNGEGSLYQQVYRAMRASIVSGQMPLGSPLPPTRVLARQLGISRTTIILAYDQLIGEGYATGKVGSGTYVNAVLPDSMARAPQSVRTSSTKELASAQVRLSEFGERVFSLGSTSDVATGRLNPSLKFDFQHIQISTEDFPFRVWREIIAQHAGTPSMGYAYPEGSPRLRQAITNHLLASRGVVCEPDQVIVVNGTQQALDLSARLLLDDGDHAAMENPQHHGARDSILAAGAHILPVPVDSSGLEVSKLESIGESARLVYVTPSHQMPTGAILSVQRRLQLLNWSSRTGAYIIEDDYDGEYRYDGRPLEALQGLDRNAKVIYIGSFSRAIFASLRLGYIVVPRPLVKPFRRAKWLTDRHAPTLPQDVLADFLSGGHFERYLRRVRARNERRRSAILAAIAMYFEDSVEVFGTGAGIHLVLNLSKMSSAEVAALIARTRKASIGIYSTSDYYLKPTPRNEILLGYAGLSEELIWEGIRLLRKCVDEV